MKRETHLIALNDLDPARTAVQHALDSASTEEQPGLRRALEILDAEASRNVDPRVRWTRTVLEEAGIAPETQEVSAVKAVRDRVPGLSLAGAVELVKETKKAQH